MKKLLKLTLLSTLLLLVSCNEKVSPELQQAASSGTVPTVVPPSEYFFTVNNVSSVLLNYKLHKTGAGNGSVACETRKNIPLSNSLYKNGADAASDITCYMEAEELALYHGGFELEVSASQNTCEYVAYSPFSYYNRMPGDSTTSLVEIACSGDITPLQISSSLGAVAATTAGGVASCNSFVDTSLTPASRDAFTVEADADLCNFNYRDGDEEQCDTCVITVSKYTLGLDAVGAVTLSPPELRTIKCGGKHYNCVAGPIKDVHTKSSFATEIYSTERNSAFAKKISFDAPIKTNFPGNFGLANYRRNLASIDIDYGDAYSTSSSYFGAFSGEKDFSPMVLDRYSNNKKIDGQSTLLATPYIEQYSYTRSAPTIKLSRARPFAAEPFLGLYGHRVNPFYTFYCLDAAKDIKSRIRIMVRDWDRTFPGGDNHELISDINLLNNSAMDVFDDEEIPDDQDPFNDYNDIADWDDILPVNRTDVAGDIIWRPSPNTPVPLWWPDGYFSPYAFPSVWTDSE